MRTLGVNALNDLYLDRTGNLAVAADLEAVRQGCEQAMKAQRGEMYFAKDEGIPTLQVVWDRYNPVQFEAAAREALLAVPNVTKVLSINAAINGSTLVYTAEIQSLYGPTSVSNG